MTELKPEDLQLQYEKETGKKWLIVPVIHGEYGFASWDYQRWLEARVIEVTKDEDGAVEMYKELNAAFLKLTAELEKWEVYCRRVLWLGHGCPPSAAYGDDGEMQCCACGIDFKRRTLAEIQDEFTRKNAPILAAFLAQKEGK